MRIGVISDTHGIVPAWDEAMLLFSDVDLILHAGDVLYHPPRLGCSPDYGLPGLVERMNSCAVPIVIARGNCDSEVYEELLKMPVQSPYAFVQAGGVRIVVQHGHTLDRDDMERIIEKYQADVLVTGHTHIPVVEKMGGGIHLNPGSPSHPKYEVGGVPTPSVGIISDARVQVVELETGRELLGLPLR